MLSDGVLKPGMRLFDYGCGRGDDLRYLAAQGYDASGWDPVHRPDTGISSAEVVILNYVINVIEDPAERVQVLAKAWNLTESVLVISARTTMDARNLGETREHEDGLITSRGTFQKFFEQAELRSWVDQILGVNSVAAAPGIFYVFRNDHDRSAFLASRFRRRIAVPRRVRSEELFSKHEELLAPLMSFVSDRGRLPMEGELQDAGDIENVFGSLRRAFQVVTAATGREQWDRIVQQRALDLLIYVALSRFDGRPSYGQLAKELQRDAKSFFPSYKHACERADELLFALSDQKLVEMACQVSEIGKLTPTALYIHESALNDLPVLLRLYEGCARRYVGKVEGANLIKLHRAEPKISYLTYPDFDDDPHPAIVSSTSVHLQTFRIKARDFRAYQNPPILHRKELFLDKGHPLYGKFSRLTRTEEQKGLYETPEKIGTRDGWEEVLQMKGLYLKGHRVLSIKT